MSKKKCKPGQHDFSDAVSNCKICKKTRSEIWIDSMDEDVPTVNSRSIQEEEKHLGHGFWGNPTSGYIYDKDNK